MLGGAGAASVSEGARGMGSTPGILEGDGARGYKRSDAPWGGGEEESGVQILCWVALALQL